MGPSTQSRPGKRLIVACDGETPFTLLFLVVFAYLSFADGFPKDSDYGFVRDSYLPWNMNGKIQNPSNVTRIVRAIRPESFDGIPQIVYYQAGLGSTGALWDRLYGGGTGAGISENIREAYAFLADNYQPGDELFLTGFSRGAFTARSIAGLIASIGLLTRRGMTYFYEIFKDWENQVTPGYVSQSPDKPFPNRPNITNPAYSKELEKRLLSRLNIPIRAVAVWETVGSLGIPQLGPFPPAASEYSFVDTKVSPNVEHAFQALALDEHRRPFSPSVWEIPKGQELPKVLKQCWFPGVHSNVGGGSYDDTQIGDLTLAWMISQLNKLLSFDNDYVLWQHDLNVGYYKQRHEIPRSWGLGEIYNSYRGIEVIAGKKVRTPGAYYATDPTTGKTTKRMLQNTNEHIHASVRLRIALGGLGSNDKGVYDPAALAGWSLVGAEHASSPTQKNVRWEYGNEEMEPERVLLEDELGDVERLLLDKWRQG